MSNTISGVGNPHTNLAAAQIARLDQIAREVAVFATMARASKISAGRSLLEARAMFPSDQQFGAWRDDVLPSLGRDTAHEYMQVAREYGDRPQVIEAVAWSTALRLSAPSTPQPVREVVEAGIAAGEAFTEAKVKAMIEAERRRADEATAKAASATAEAERQRAKADALAEGQRDLIEAAKEQAKREAEAKAAADLDKAKAEAQRANAALAEQQRKLTEATKKAEDAAMEKAQAEAENLAAAELEKLRDEAHKAKRRKDDAEQEVSRLKGQADFLGKRVDELKGYIRATESAQDEAASIDQAMKKVVQAVSDAMTLLQCLRHDHDTEVSKRVRQAAEVFSRSAEALESRIVGRTLIHDAEYVAA
ncbi:hypothetical protein [Pseudogemmobacter sonorensis]|uniref:hypothetical protein n=1 Tax=Pseudogemmobacter sonorensis TaxID=2989681 RepID=UPI0036752767